MTTDYCDLGLMPSMIYLPAYLHLCESAEVLGSGVACNRLFLTYKLATLGGNASFYFFTRRCYEFVMFKWFVA